MRGVHSLPRRRSSDLGVARGDAERVGTVAQVAVSLRRAAARGRCTVELALEARPILARERERGRLVVGSEEHTSELQSLTNNVCRRLLATTTREVDC